MSDVLHQAAAVTGVEPYRTEVTIGDQPRFVQVTDAASKDGGNDIGASPVAQLTGALASCKTITAKIYANHKGWPLEAVSVHVRHVRKDIDGTKRDAFECDVQLKGDLDDEQRRRIYEITAKCPVHKLLAGETAIESSLTD